MDPLATRKHLFATDEEIERIGDLLEGGQQLTLPDRTHNNSPDYRQAWYRRDAPLWASYLHKVTIVNKPSVKPRDRAKRTQDIVVSVVFLPDQPSKRSLPLRTQVLVRVGLCSVLFNPATIGQELYALREFET